MSKKYLKNPKIIYFFYPGDINTKTGGYIYEKNIIEYAKSKKLPFKSKELSSNYPFPLKQDLDELKQILLDIPVGSTLLFDGLIFECLKILKKDLSNFKIVALIHHPLYLEFNGKIGLRFFSLEKEMFKIPNKFIVTSNETKRLLLKEFEINKELISVIEPGIERLIKAKKKFNQKHNLLTCGSIIERKNYLYLLSELIFMNNLTLNIIGDTSRDNYYYKKVIAFIKKHKIENRVKIHSNVSKTKLSNLYSQCDLYVSVSKYEGFGMSLANAIIFKKPIITYKTTTLRNTLGSKGVVYFNNFKKNTLAKIINKILLNTKAFKELESQIIKNNKVFLTPLKSAKLFIKEVRNA